MSAPNTCQALTKKGVQCRNRAKGFCHLHKSAASSPAAEASSTPSAAPAAEASSTPTVVRLKSKQGKVVQDCDVYIGRDFNMGGWRLSKSYWHNPYTVKEHGRDEALRKYKEHVLTLPNLKERLSELKGKRLGCFCHPEPCHGDVLVALYKEHFEQP